jgi:hypothetical protein
VCVCVFFFSDQTDVKVSVITWSSARRRSTEIQMTLLVVTNVMARVISLAIVPI